MKSPTEPNRLRVSVLGPVRAWRGRRELNLGPTRQRALFAVLAAAGRPVGRDELIEDLWGTSPPPTAVGSIYTYVSGLRRSLGRESLSSGPAGYTLHLPTENLDSNQFTALCAEAARLRDAGDLAAAADRLDEGLRLWHGEAYDGLEGQRLELWRSQLAERRLAAAEQRVRILTARGDDSVLAELPDLIRDHPLHEPFYEILMLALESSGRHTEAVEVYRRAARTLHDDLGVEPNADLTALYERVQAAAVPQFPTPGSLAGRGNETEQLRKMALELSAGRGAAVWIEGEPGIGKTELVSAVFARTDDLGCQVAWGSVAEHDQRVPIDAALRALGLPGPDRTERGHADRLLARVRTACGTAPLVLVLDGLQWTDKSGPPFWDQLIAATRRLPLLVVGTARLEPNDGGLTRMRRSVGPRNVLRLGALPADAVEQVVTRVAGAPPGPNLAAVVPASAGNPLWAREMTAALVRHGAVRVAQGRAEIPDGTALEVPRSVRAVMRFGVDGLTHATQEVLRTAAVLGARFAVDDVVAVTGGAPLAVVGSLEEALAANIVVDAGTDLAFRHAFLRQILYEDIPAPTRAVLHRHIAAVLDRGGSPVTRVSEQLADSVVDQWTVSWLDTHCDELGRRRPWLAAELLRRVLETRQPDRGQRERLLTALVKLDFRHGRRPLSETQEAVGLARTPGVRAELRQLLAVMAHQGGDLEAATGTLREALTDPEIPDLWRTRHRVLLAQFRRGPLDDLDRADRTARTNHATALAADRPYEAAFALQTQWLTNSIRRDHEQALEYADRALAIVRNRPGFPGLYFDLLDKRTFSLQNLDRPTEAEQTLREGALFSVRNRLPHCLPGASAVHHYWSGRWDKTAAEVDAVSDEAAITVLGMREPGAEAMLLHGLAALVAARRNDRVLAGQHLDAAEPEPTTAAERQNCDFMLVARGLLLEQQARGEDALQVLDPLLTPGYAPLMLRHQWLPDLSRLALSLGRRDLADRALAVCLDEAAKEKRRGRAHAAAAHCRALNTGDPRPALDTAAQYRQVGRIPELASALEDAAVLLAASRRPNEAAQAGGEAAGIYTTLGAEWDLNRLRRRLAGYGIEPDAAPRRAA